MNKEKRRVPKLRFPGFTEDWEQRKLGNLYNAATNSLPYVILLSAATSLSCALT